MKSATSDLVHLLAQEYAKICSLDANQLMNLVSFVQDRPGHDLRYGIDPAKIQSELKWEPAHNFTDGMRKTIQWYLQHPERLTL